MNVKIGLMRKFAEINLPPSSEGVKILEKTITALLLLIKGV